MLLQLSRTDIVFNFNPAAPMETSLTVYNTSPNSIVTFKIKTTSPNKFEVNPSKGILRPSESRVVAFRTNSAVSREEAERMLAHEKFLIQWMPITGIRPSQEIEEMWKKNRNNPQIIQSMKLRLVIEGVGVGQLAGSTAAIPEAYQTTRNQPEMERTVYKSTGNLFPNVGNPSNATPQGSAYEEELRLENLKREQVLDKQIQERLELERQEQYDQATAPKKSSSCGSWLKSTQQAYAEILVVLFFCGVGWIIHKQIEERRKHPKVVITQEYHANPNDNIIKIGNERAQVERVQISDSAGSHTVTTTQQQPHTVIHEEVISTRPASSVSSGIQPQKTHKKVILTAPEDAEVIVNRINNESIRLTVLGAQQDSEGLRIEY